MSCVSLWQLPRAWTPWPYTLSLPYLLSLVQYTMCRAIQFSVMLMTLIVMPKIIWFISKPNVDVGNAIFTSNIFPMNADCIKDWLKNWPTSLMIIQVIPRMVSSLYMSGCSAYPIMTCLSFHSSLKLLHCSPHTVNVKTVKSVSTTMNAYYVASGGGGSLLSILCSI